MWNVQQTISKNLVTAIPAVMVLGFISGLLGDVSWLKGLIVPFTFLMVYPMMVTLKINQVFSGGEIPGHDLVVMGAHGRGVFADMLRGSVARKVVRLSPVPVLTVRLPGEKEK